MHIEIVKSFAAEGRKRLMHRLWLLTLICLLALPLGLGCSGKKYEIRFRKRSPQAVTIDALKNDNPDIRYKSLKELAKSNSYKDDWAVMSIEVIARTDPSPSVRALAVHTLGRVADKEVVKVLKEALNDPNGRVRAEAAWALAQIDFENIGMNKKERESVSQALSASLASDESVDVRINSAMALEHFKDRKVLYALIAALKDKDFAVQFQAEKSLVLLTGKTFYGNADKWVAWFEDTKNPFENSGHIPPELVKPKRSSWQRTKGYFYRLYLDWQGPAKH